MLTLEKKNFVPFFLYLINNEEVKLWKYILFEFK